jgi:hypothetical protein
VELTRAIHRNAIGVASMFQTASHLLGDSLKRVIPTKGFKVVTEVAAEQWLAEPTTGEGFSDRGTFDAHLAQVGGVLSVATGCPHWIAFCISAYGSAFLGRG